VTIGTEQRDMALGGSPSRARDILARLRDSPWFHPALALLPALVTALPLWTQTPMSHDHPTHAFKAWHFWTEMLGRGRLRGWSHFWGFGFPSDELVPSGGEVWVALFRVLTLGQLSWLRTYALAFGAFLLLKALAAFVFTRRFFGARAGVIAAWLTALDVGAFSQGGWVWNTEWGVWPVSLSMCFCLLAFVQLDSQLRLGRARHALCAGVLIAAALLAHQVAVFVIAVAPAFLLLERCAGRRQAPLSRLAGALGTLLFGVLLAAFSVVPFVARSRYTMDLGVADVPLSRKLLDILELRVFSRQSPVVHGLAIVGGLLALRAKRRGAVFVSASALACVLLSSELLLALHLERLLPSLIKIEAARMLLVAKLFWFPLVGYAATRLWSLAARASRPGLQLGLRAALVAALVLPPLPRMYQTFIEKGLQGETDTAYWAGFERAFSWAKGLRERQPGLYRIAYDMHPDDHTSTLAPVYGGGLTYKIGSTPSQIFDGVPMGGYPELLQALSVSHVVSARPLDEPLFTLEESFGALAAYRFNRQSADPFSLVGAGRAELLEFEPERVRVRLRGTNEQSRLRIHVAAYARWQASVDGRALPIRPVPVHGADDPVLMEVPAPPGELLLEYTDGPPDRLGRWLSLAALPAFFGVALLGRRPPRAFAILERHRRSLGLGLGLAALLLAAALLVAARQVSHVLPASSIFYSDVELSLGEHACERRGVLEFQCGPHRVHGGLVHVRGAHLCMQAPLDGVLSVRLKTPPGALVAGRYDAKDVPGWIEARLGGQLLGRVETRPAYMLQQTLQFDTRDVGRGGDLELLLSGGTLRCFDFWLR
jgi:hypothetical protein